MSEDTFMGVPRSSIDWSPRIDYGKCNYCMECVKFCQHNVFEVKESEERKLAVKNPDNCVVFCRALPGNVRLGRPLLPGQGGSDQENQGTAKGNGGQSVRPTQYCRATASTSALSSNF